MTSSLIRLWGYIFADFIGGCCTTFCIKIYHSYTIVVLHICSVNIVVQRAPKRLSLLLNRIVENVIKTRGQSAQDPPNPSRRLFCSDAISDEDIDRTGKVLKRNRKSF